MNIELPSATPGGLYHPQQPIVLETRLGRRIANGIGVEPNESGRQLYTAEVRRHPNWKNRRPANGTYNCWGMVFASRRTGIYEDEEIARILEDDGYRLVRDHNDIFPADVAVYKTRSENVLLHGAIVVHVHDATACRITVLSKWNIGYGEDFHDINDVLDLWRGTCKWEIWTDRPERQPSFGSIALQ